MIKCPYCNNSYYELKYSSTTCLGWAHVYKDGELISSNPNTTTHYCLCLACGQEFTYTEGGIKTTEVPKTVQKDNDTYTLLNGLDLASTGTATSSFTIEEVSVPQSTVDMYKELITPILQTTFTATEGECENVAKRIAEQLHQIDNISVCSNCSQSFIDI